MKRIKVLPLPPEWNHFTQEEVIKHNVKELSDFLKEYNRLAKGLIDISATVTEDGKITTLYSSIQKNALYQNTGLTMWFDCAKQQLDEFCITTNLSFRGYYNILYSCLETNKKIKSEKF